MCGEREVATRLWESAGLKSVCEAAAGRLGSPGFSPEAEFLLCETSVIALQVFN